MKASLLLLALTGPLGLAQAQTTPLPRVTVTQPSPAQTKAIREQTADRRAATYQGPKVVKDSKKLGREMLKDSKPVPTQVTHPVKE